MAVTKLYRATDDGLEYWENWIEEDVTVVHWGRVGERGEVRRMDRAEFVEYAATKVHELYREGYREIEEEDHHLVLVVVPADALPQDADAVEALWERLESMLNEELGWTGLGHCSGVDLSSEMVAMGDVVDPVLGVRVIAEALVRGDPPAGTVIAVREGGRDDGHDVIRWPPERDGEDAPL